MKAIFGSHQNVLILKSCFSYKIWVVVLVHMNKNHLEAKIVIVNQYQASNFHKDKLNLLVRGDNYNNRFKLTQGLVPNRTIMLWTKSLEYPIFKTLMWVSQPVS